MTPNDFSNDLTTPMPLLLSLTLLAVLLSQLVFISSASPLFIPVSTAHLPAPTSPASPYKSDEQQLLEVNRAWKRDYEPGDVPYFPADIPSCVACQPAWSSIDSCAEAAPAFQDFTYMILNPATFIAEIKCACTDTFQSAYPQCVDCFVQTNQCSQYLGVPSDSGASSILNGMRQVCGFGSALLGGVASSQASAGISYTYTAEPSQGYSTTTSYGVGGLDLGSSQGASSTAPPTKVVRVWWTVFIGLVGMVLVAL
ncbi:hypothetical protein MNV49_006427 [Pseudohyphozyma bogoriensis]|nr:hypothetical protein MNV49_006427 [Pseudohyphozyma bogoriensis]